MAQSGLGIHNLLRVLEKNLSALSAEVPAGELERIAVIVSTSMGALARRFHTLNHVAGFLSNADPETVLAAVFHDLVYLNIDKTVHPALEAPLSRFFILADQKVLLKKELKSSEEIPRHFVSLMKLFGVEYGQELTPATGMNEFLSASAFAILLGGRVDRKTFLAVSACIEASIPFRPSKKDSGPFQDLETRLLSLGVSSGDAGSIVRRAVRFANTDVFDFQHEDPAYFLNNTWKLLPEIHPHLLLQGSYTITDYRKALYGMGKFLGSLSPERIYHRYKDEPAEEVFRGYLSRSALNLQTAVTYIDAKLLAAGLLEAVAKLTGGDVPLVLFTGDASSGEQGEDRLERHLPGLPEESRTDPVYSLLALGRLSDSCFDIKNSPLALYLFLNLDEDSFLRAAAQAQKFFAGKAGPEDYLEIWDRKVLLPFLSACAKMVPTRIPEIEELSRRFS